MNCQEIINLMDGYLDNELDPITSQAIEQHLRGCPNCEQAYKAHGSLVRAIGSATPYYKAPAELVLKHFVAGEKLPGSVEELADKIAEEALKDGAFGLFLSEKQQVAGKAGEVLVKSKKEGEAKHGE